MFILKINEILLVSKILCTIYNNDIFTDLFLESIKREWYLIIHCRYLRKISIGGCLLKDMFGILYVDVPCMTNGTSFGRPYRIIVWI